jgi:gluconate 2-dehydrogenase gamma chain
MTFISRRDLLKAAAAVPAVPVGRVLWTRLLPHAGSTEAGLQASSPVILTVAEAEILDSVVARLIPADALGPGAKEAGATRYIDRALADALSASRDAYRSGLAALDRYARSSRGKGFAELLPADQDSVLIDVETGAATGFAGSSAAFFAMVLNHTHQGTFGDPFYGGNRDFVGWDLIGYPGVRTMVSGSDQKALENGQLKPNHKSAYDYESFTKAST